MSSVTDLRSIGISYKIYDARNDEFVKSIYVIDMNDVLDCTGQFTPEYETASEYMSYALTCLTNFFDIKRISWQVFKNDQLDIEQLARVAYEENTDVIVVEYIDDSEEIKL